MVFLKGSGGVREKIVSGFRAHAFRLYKCKSAIVCGKCFLWLAEGEDLTLPRYYLYVALNIHVNSKSSNLYVFNKAFSVTRHFS